MYGKYNGHDYQHCTSISKEASEEKIESHVFLNRGPSSNAGLHTFDNVDRLIENPNLDSALPQVARVIKGGIPQVARVIKGASRHLWLLQVNVECEETYT